MKDSSLQPLTVSKHHRQEVVEARYVSSVGAHLHRGLGRREREIMAVLWEWGSSSVQQVSQHLSTALAYTTVMTTLDRLFKKGLLQREKVDRAFVYSASLTPQEVEERRAAFLVSRFFKDSQERPDLLLSCLVDAVHQYNTSLLDELESKIRLVRDQHMASVTVKREED